MKYHSDRESVWNIYVPMPLTVTALEHEMF